MREDELIRKLNTSKEGTNYNNMVLVAEENGFEVFASNVVSLEQLKSFIDNGYPVIVIVQAWADRYMPLEDWKFASDCGHYAIVIGYQDHIIIFEDPSSIHRTWMSEEEFLARWHDVDINSHEKVEHFAMVLMGKQPVARVLEHMD